MKDVAGRAIRGCMARDHVDLHNDPPNAQDQALRAAQTGRTEG